MSVILYYRVSSLEQAKEDRYSLPTQQELGRSFAKSINEPYVEYQDVKSAYDVSIRREGLEQLIQDIEAGKADKLWIISIDRLIRSQEESLFFRKLFQKHNISLYEKDVLISFDEIQQKLLWNIRSIFAEFEIDTFKQRVKRSKDELAKKGNKKVARLYGYKKIYDEKGNSKCILDEQVIHVVKYIFSLREKGNSYKIIADILNSENYKPPKAKLWEPSLVYAIVNNILYTGYYYFDNELVKSNIYQPIIDLSLYNKLKKHEPNRPINYTSAHLLTSLLFCKECQGRLYFRQPTSNTNNRFYYFKHNHSCKQKNDFFNYYLLNSIVENCYYYLCSHKSKIEQIFRDRNEELLQQRNKIDEDRKRYSKRLEDLNHQKDRLIDNVARGLLKDNEIQNHMETIRSEEYKINALLKETEYQLNLSEEQYYYLLNEFQEKSILMFIFREESGKREILKKLVKGFCLNRIFEIVFLDELKFSFELPFGIKEVEISTYDKKTIFFRLEKVVWPTFENIGRKEFLDWIQKVKEKGAEHIEPFLE